MNKKNLLRWENKVFKTSILEGFFDWSFKKKG